MKKFLALAVLLATVLSASAAITHGSNQRNALAQSVLDSCGATAKVVLMDGSNNPLDTVALANPAFTRAGVTLTMAGAPRSSTASGIGTIAKFKVLGTSGSILFQGTVATSGGDLTIDNTSVVVGQTVNVTSLTYTAAP